MNIVFSLKQSTTIDVKDLATDNLVQSLNNDANHELQLKVVEKITEIFGKGTSEQKELVNILSGIEVNEVC